MKRMTMLLVALLALCVLTACGKTAESAGDKPRSIDPDLEQSLSAAISEKLDSFITTDYTISAYETDKGITVSVSIMPCSVDYTFGCVVKEATPIVAAFFADHDLKAYSFHVTGFRENQSGEIDSTSYMDWRTQDFQTGYWYDPKHDITSMTKKYTPDEVFAFYADYTEGLLKAFEQFAW